MKLQTLKPRIQATSTPRLPVLTASKAIVKRITGRALQALRLRIWTVNPRCAMCGRVTEYGPPSTFDLDHIVAIDNQGTNEDSNLQILCNGVGQCHEIKTAHDLGHTKAIRRKGWGGAKV